MKLGLSLSGGGYRAAAFHLGTLRKLKQMNILDKIDVLSTVSGGSIIGAYYCLFNHDFDEFEKNFTSLLKRSIVKKVFFSATFIRLLFFVLFSIAAVIFFLFYTPYSWISLVLILLGVYAVINFQYRIFPVSKIIEKLYDDFFFLGRTLKEIYRERPELIICSTNLQTGRQFYFSKNKMMDSTLDDTYGGEQKVRFLSDNFPISRAVMCSSCVPFAFSPVSIEEKYISTNENYKSIQPILIDGGIYDNQGIHKLTHTGGEYECDIVITSDAGYKLPFKESYNNFIELLMRTSELFMNRIKLFQIMQNLYYNTDKANREITYISLGWDLKNCIPGFVRNLREGKITNTVIKLHGF